MFRLRIRQAGANLSSHNAATWQRLMNGGLALLQSGWSRRVMSVMICLAMCDALLAAESPSFEREVRPILSRFCFKCHGPDDAQRSPPLSTFTPPKTVNTRNAKTPDNTGASH